MSKTVIGCWDCDYCGSDRISGDVKICPHCGKPRGKDITFYVAGPKKYADPDAVSKNPDWLCPYCNTLNPDSSGFCSACGASREESEGDVLTDDVVGRGFARLCLLAESQDDDRPRRVNTYPLSPVMGNTS